MKYSKILALLAAALMPSVASAVPTGEPAIVFHSSAQNVIGTDNQFSFLIGTTAPGTYTIVDGFGERQAEFGAVNIDTSTGEFTGNWISYKAPDSGEIKIYGDASKIDVIVADGAYITSLDMPQCSNLEILSLEYNALEKLDLSAFSNLAAIYLTSNPFTAETPLKVGPNKPHLQILELDIIDYMDQSFNLSDYPALVSFDGYHNMDLRNVDPTGCPNLMVLSVEMAPVETLDVTKNPELLRLNISETRIRNIDLSNNTRLEHLLAGHDSGTINTGYRLDNIDLSHNPNLTILNLNGNKLPSVDLSANTKLTNLSLTRNSLTALDLSANTALYSVTVMLNDMDYATLPLPQATWGEYFYSQNAMPVARSLAAGAELDLSSRVLRDGTTTLARVWKQNYNGEDEFLDESLYTYANGKLTFPQALADSVYVEFQNSVFTEYSLYTTKFMVKAADEIGKPSNILTLTPSSTGRQISLGIGLYGATPESPREFYVDFGDGVLKTFSAVSDLDPADNVTGIFSGMLSMYIPEGEVLTAFVARNVPAAGVNVTKATELRQLVLTDCGLYNINLAYNRCLSSLDLSGNNLRELDLQGVYGDYEKNVLTDIAAARNMLTSFNNISTRATKTLDLSDNQLETMVLKDYDNLVKLDLSGNLLTETDLEYLTSATDVDLSDNRLTSIAVCPTAVTENLDISGNLLNYGTLPLPATLGQGYVYAPQSRITIPATAPMVNLSEYDAYVGGNQTQFTWKKADGTTLAEGTDYRISGGQTTFLNAELGKVYCELTNATFPMMTGENVLRTTETEVTGAPTHLVASFKTRGTKENPEVIFAANDPVQLYIDWTGNGSDLTAYEVETTYKSFPVNNVKRNAEVKIYASDANVASSINVFSIYDITLDAVDLSRLTGAYSISLGNAGLDESKLTLPDVTGLGELNLGQNNFTSFPYAAKYPNLYNLNLSGNRLTEFNFAEVPSLGYVILSGNMLTKLDGFDNPELWSIIADSNEIESVELDGLPALGQLLLQSNNMTEIDIEPVKSSLYGLSIVGNYFTFPTLPKYWSYPGMTVFYYANQAPVDAQCNDMTIDLSSQAEVEGSKTNFAWYLDLPVYNPDTDEIEGDLLTEGTDYEIENGVTHFLKGQDKPVICVMTNSLFPNLTLTTDLITLDMDSIDSVIDETQRDASVYNLQGIKVAESTENLPAGIYVTGGKKIIVK